MGSYTRIQETSKGLYQEIQQGGYTGPTSKQENEDKPTK